MGVLKVTLFHVNPVAPWANQVFATQILKGNAFLRPYGLQFDVYPKVGSLDLDWSAPISSASRSAEGIAQRLALRAAAHARYASFDNRLPVILCQVGGQGGGEAPGSLGLTPGIGWLPWVIMDAFTLMPDGLSMTHEAGHCAGLLHPGDPPNGDRRLLENGAVVTNNIMAYGSYDLNNTYQPRNLIEDWQIEAFRHAYFHSG
ncbi:zinc metalloprotease [Roseomonas rosulenta]|uniref:hypothetical protein n=1 Tax=Roseomonas rosulenta TaxID=2748667 RepID=UPI0018E01B60|nr:hypothetical protein [Roseomonas rosulenta]